MRIAVHGTGAGTGKSAIASRISNVLRWGGKNCTCIHEMDLMAAQPFQSFAASFMTGTPEMVDRLKVLVDWIVEPGGSVSPEAAQPVVYDSLLPCLHWLLLGDLERSHVDAFARWIGDHLNPLEPRYVHLVAESSQRTERAVRQRGATWREKHTARHARYPLIKRLGEEEGAIHVESELRRLVASLPWPTTEIMVDGRSVEEVLRVVTKALDLVHPLDERGVPAGSPEVDGRLPPNHFTRLANERSRQPGAEPKRRLPDTVEILEGADGIALRVGALTLPLLAEPDGTMLVEGNNAWIARTARNAFELRWFGFDPAIYVGTTR